MWEVCFVVILAAVILVPIGIGIWYRGRAAGIRWATRQVYGSSGSGPVGVSVITEFYDDDSPRR